MGEKNLWKTGMKRCRNKVLLESGKLLGVIKRGKVLPKVKNSDFYKRDRDIGMN